MKKSKVLLFSSSWSFKCYAGLVPTPHSTRIMCRILKLFHHHFYYNIQDVRQFLQCCIAFNIMCRILKVVLASGWFRL